MQTKGMFETTRSMQAESAMYFITQGGVITSTEYGSVQRLETRYAGTLARHLLDRNSSRTVTERCGAQFLTSNLRWARQNF